MKRKRRRRKRRIRGSRKRRRVKVAVVSQNRRTRRKCGRGNSKRWVDHVIMYNSVVHASDVIFITLIVYFV